VRIQAVVYRNFLVAIVLPFISGCFATFHTGEVLRSGEKIHGLQVIGMATGTTGWAKKVMSPDNDMDDTAYYFLAAYFRMGLGKNVDFGLWGSPFAKDSKRIWTFPYFIPFGGDIKWQFVQEEYGWPAMSLDIDLRWLPPYYGVGLIASRNVGRTTGIYGGYKILNHGYNELFAGLKQEIGADKWLYLNSTHMSASGNTVMSHNIGIMWSPD